jgi:hypothetical protein
MRNFGLGSLWGVPTGSNVTPRRFAVLKDVSLDMGGELDMLRGEKMFAIDAAKKGGKVSGKIGFAQLDLNVLSWIIPGVTKTTGTVRTIVEETGTVPAVSTYIVTVANSATWLTDLGVINGTTGVQMTRGASATGTGVYSCAAGVYTFHSTDASTPVRISYTYTVAGSGSTYTIDNSVMAVATPFTMLLGNGASGSAFTVKLPSVYIPKLGFGLKSEGWSEYALDYEATADTSGKVGYIYTDDS